MRMPFDRIFMIVEGQIIPLVHVSIGNVAFAAGVPIPPPLTLEGVEMKDFAGHDLEIEREDGLTVIKGLFRGSTH
jgi:hypothetical protein